MPLSDLDVKNAKPGINPKRKPGTKPNGKAYPLSDGRGLSLLVQPEGGKWWRFRYRFNGKSNSLSLGVYPDVGLKTARDRRDAARKLIADGIDPSENRKAIKAAKAGQAANSFEVVAREWFEMKKPEWAESHASKIIARLENDVFPWLGSKPIAELSAVEILATLKRISERGAKDTAKRAQQDCGQVFRYAIQTGRTRYNPIPDLRGALPAPMSGHFAALTEPKQVGELLRAVDGFQGTFVVKSALLLSPFVFVRPGELRQARWKDIDLDKAEWKLPASKVKKTETPRIHLVPLAKQAVAVLKELQALTGDSEFVFPGARSNGRAMSDAAVNAALRRMGYDTQNEMTGHGFRAMARTILHEELGVDSAVIEHQLAHKVPDALGDAYNRTKFIAQRRLMMQQWADYLEKLKVGAAIIPIDGKAA